MCPGACPRSLRTRTQWPAGSLVFPAPLKRALGRASGDWLSRERNAANSASAVALCAGSLDASCSMRFLVDAVLRPLRTLLRALALLACLVCAGGMSGQVAAQASAAATILS